MLRKWSPSTRRAWIEILNCNIAICDEIVALHPEGVDRNTTLLHVDVASNLVALHPEGVDRNICVEKDTCKVFRSRPPPGGRG